MAMSQWVRLKANMSLGAYEITLAESVMAEPVWPELSFQELGAHCLSRAHGHKFGPALSSSGCAGSPSIA